MKTIVIQIGSFDKKAGVTFNSCLQLIECLIKQVCAELIFQGGSTSAPWTCFTWTVKCSSNAATTLKTKISLLRQVFDDNTITWMETEPQIL